MNILIIGANGLLGRNLVRELSTEHTIYAIIRDKKIINFKLNNNIIIIESDLLELKFHTLPKNIDVIYYVAQSNRFREFPEGSLDILLINVIIPNKLANWAVNNGVKSFIYTSSGGVYNKLNEPVKEFFDINTNNKLGFYLNSKLSAEMLLRNYAQYFETFIILRPFFMYGIEQKKDMLIPRLIENIKNNKEIILNNNVGIKINPINILDASKIIRQTINLKGEYTINIAGDEIISIKSLSEKIGNFLKIEPLFKYTDEITNDLIADTKSMNANLGYTKISLDKSIFNMVQ